MIADLDVVESGLQKLINTKYRDIQPIERWYHSFWHEMTNQEPKRPSINDIRIQKIVRNYLDFKPQALYGLDSNKIQAVKITDGYPHPKDASLCVDVLFNYGADFTPWLKIWCGVGEVYVIGGPDVYHSHGTKMQEHDCPKEEKFQLRISTSTKQALESGDMNDYYFSVFKYDDSVRGVNDYFTHVLPEEFRIRLHDMQNLSDVVERISDFRIIKSGFSTQDIPYEIINGLPLTYAGHVGLILDCKPGEILES